VFRWITAVLSLVVLGGIVTAYLAGYFLLWSFHLNPASATPLTAARYAYYFGTNTAIHRRVLLCSAFSLLLTGTASFVLVLPRRRSLHGDARFATRGEIARLGLLGNEGLILGRFGRRYLMLPGQQSVIVAAPPRSGKGTGIVIPNALNFPGSLVVLDIKRENWTLTAAYRAARGQACYLLDLLSEDGRTHRWNCLSYVSGEPGRRINDLQRIADILYSETPGTDPFWTSSARSLFVGIALYLFETPSLPKTIGEIRRQGMATDDEGFGAHWKRIVEGRQSGSVPLSDECVRALYDIIDLAPVTASSVRKTFTSRLELFANPLLDAATAADDFDLTDLRKKPISIYVAVNPDDLHRIRPVISLFFQQLIGIQTRELPEHNPALKYQVALLLDEGTAPGRPQAVKDSMPFLPGYNVRVVLIIQALSQLRDEYGPHAAETMLKSAAARVVFAPKDYPDAKEISDELGTTTVRARALSRPQFGSWGRGSSRAANVTLSEQARPLMLPQEIKELGKDKSIVIYENLRPILCSKVRYYRERAFKRRLMPPLERPARAALAVAPPRASRANGPGMDEKGGGPDELRAATLEDVARLGTLTLEDFPEAIQNLTFKHKGDHPTESEIEQDVQKFLEAMR